MRYDVVVVGSINVDLVLTVPRHPLPGETLLGGSGAHFAGGKGANQAVAAARLGAVTAMVGAVGDDATAATALAELRAADVDLAAVAVHPGPTGLAVVTLADDGENTIVVVAGANASVTTERVDAAAGTIGAAAVCVLQAEIPLDAVARAAEVAAAAGVRVVLNVAPACTLPLATLRLADPLVVNEHELAIVLTAVDHGADLAPLTGDPDALGDGALTRAARLHALGVPSVLVTLGAAGVVGVEADGSWSEPARTVTPRDTTGAGDAFVGALATHLARGATLRDAAVIATRVAAYSVQRLGAQASYPWKDDPLP
ncbi:ribokinase [Cellulomonas sp. KRMCY2]|uniref:ribokinase n=1 Tax=Cellulomonas sp. KRMCY2 TaxID=1304865 RepID=UPI00045EC183|nr:ribokinase [Cellulomonas sp. KRMCY2]